MQVTQTLNVDAQSLFDLIVESAANDAAAAKGKRRVPTSKIKLGYTYQRTYVKGSNSVTTTVKVIGFEAPRLYAVEISSSQGSTSLSYELEPEGEEKVKVTYTEDFEGASAGTTVTTKLRGRVNAHRAKKQIKERLHQMEGHIIAERLTAGLGDDEASEDASDKDPDEGAK